MGKQKRKPVRPTPVAGPAPDPAVSVGETPTPILLCCRPGYDNFIDEFIAGLAPDIPFTKLVSDRPAEIEPALRRHQAVWLEWGNDLSAAITKELGRHLKGKRVFLRIHHYEVLERVALGIDYRPVTDLIFVCNLMRDLLLRDRPEIRGQVERIHVIPNGVDLERYRLTPRPPGRNLAYIGFLNYKKAPILLMHAFEALHRRDPSCRLNVAGSFQDAYNQNACHAFLANNGLTGAVAFHGWVADIPAWLADKQYLISTSLSESQGMGIMEAMASGCEPLIYNFVGAELIYGRRWLWNNLSELAARLDRPPDPAAARQFVAANYSLAAQLTSLRRMILGQEEIGFAGPRL
ncbi:MAG: glycosyltransferase family 4 protein [Thermodesulfobacteriota bacterium]